MVTTLVLWSLCVNLTWADDHKECDKPVPLAVCLDTGHEWRLRAQAWALRSGLPVSEPAFACVASQRV